MSKRAIKILLTGLFALFFIFGIMEHVLAKERGEGLHYKLIQCKDGKHSYVVYLPPNYNESKKWPVLFCFDPSACGDYAAKVFSSASVNQGWIVVGSLDARNGPWEPIYKAQTATLEDVTQRYSIDEQRLYSAGFSGGARMAYTMAYKYPDKFRGVIACGAGFGEGQVSKNVAVFHCVGKGDDNLIEVRATRDTLLKEGVKTKMKAFEGGHEWPPEEVIVEALDWLARTT